MATLISNRPERPQREDGAKIVDPKLTVGVLKNGSLDMNAVSASLNPTKCVRMSSEGLMLPAEMAIKITLFRFCGGENVLVLEQCNGRRSFFSYSTSR